MKGFEKTAIVASTITPEEYYELKHEKDPYIGTLLGQIAGAGAGAHKAGKGHRGKGAAVGALAGGAAGALSGAAAKHLLSKYQSHKVRKAVEELNLRSTPTRHRGHE